MGVLSYHLHSTVNDDRGRGGGDLQTGLKLGYSENTPTEDADWRINGILAEQKETASHFHLIELNTGDL